MGQQNVEAQLTDMIKRYPQIKESILEMEKDRAGGENYEPRNTLHAEEFRKVLRNAKRLAWSLLLEDEQSGGKASMLTREHELGLIGDRSRKIGDYSTEERTKREIENLKNLPK
jgi:hypothetical protein